MSSIRVATLLAVVPLSACTLFNSHVVVSRRFKAPPVESVTAKKPLECSGKDAGDSNCVEAQLSAMPIPADPPLAVTALSDRGQGAYIHGLAEASTGTDALTSAVAAPLKPAAASLPAYQDASAIKLRFELALMPQAGTLAPGDRVDWAQVVIEPRSPDGTPARFIGWTQAANAHETIDVGSVTAGRTESVGISGGLALTPAVTGPSLNTQLGSSRSESATLTERTSIYAGVSDGKGWISQYGGWRRDLTGTSIFDATVALSPEKTQPLEYTVTGELKVKPAKPGSSPWQDPAKVTFTQREVRVPRREPLCAQVTLDFIVRHIRSGARTFTESDDRVELVRGHASSTQLVAPPVLNSGWRVAAGGELLQFAGPGVQFILTFPDKGAAADFLAWFRNAKVTGPVAGGSLFFRHPGERIDVARLTDLDAINGDAKANWKALSMRCQAPTPVSAP